MERLANLITRHAVIVLIGLLVLTALSVTQIIDVRTGRLRLSFDPSASALFPRDSEELKYYQHVRRIFGSDETLVLALVDDGGIFNHADLEAVKRLTERIQDLKGVHHVTSLANALNIQAANGDLEIEPFISKVPDDPKDLARIHDEALANPIYSGNLVNHAGTATALLIYLDDMTDAQFLESGLDGRIEKIAAEERGDARTMLTGGALLKAENTRIGLHDLFRATPMVTVVMALIALVAYRSLLGVLVPLLAIGLATLWTVGVMGASGRNLNLITLMVPAIVQTIGFAYAIHVVSDYYAVLKRRGRAAPVSSQEAASEALSEVALPVLLTGLTTAIGFGSLAFSPLGAVREFGFYCVAAVTSTLLASLCLPPALFALLPDPRPSAMPAEPDPQKGMGGILGRLALFDLDHRNWILGAAALVALVSALGLPQIRVGMDLVSLFPKGHRVRADFEAINKELEGASLFYVVFEADYPNAFKEPANLKQIQNVQKWLVAQPEIGGTTSLVDYVSLINRGFHDNDPAYQRIPETKALLSQLLFFGGNDELERVVDSRYQTTSVIVRSKVIESTHMAELIKRIDDRLAQLPPHMRARVTGNGVLVTRLLNTLSRGQVQSLTLAFVLIYIVMAGLFTSFRVGALALIPNVLPVIFFFGILGWTGITLNPSTSLVACIALGIAVDDTIHYLTRFNVSAKRLADERKGAVEALRSIGAPMTFTTVALCLGFLVLMTSQMKIQVEFGGLAALTLFFAWVADMTLTPALSSHLRIVSLWDMLSLDLGRDPVNSIPLFKGLRTSQARIVALMTSLRNYPKGDRVFRAGEQGDDMYVVIDGQLSVVLRTEEGPITLADLSRGDAVGEVALFSGTRSADVEARSDVRLLRFTRADLERLRRRYPRIGAQVLENLSEILAIRLMDANRRVSQ